MAKNVYSNALNKRAKAKKAAVGVAQTKKIPGRESEMTANNAGGQSFTLDKWGYARRFLILGTESNTYYTSAQKLTAQNATNLIACAKEDGVRLVDMIAEVSERGLAPKNDPALFALAIAITHGNDHTKHFAAEAFPMVARIGTHVFHLADFINGMRSWGRPVRRGFANIYEQWNDYQLAMQVVKYASRDGWSHADVIKLAHIRPDTPTKDALFARVLDKPEQKEIADAKVAAFIDAVDRVKSADEKTAVKLITDYRLPREVVPTELLNSREVWAALLPHMGMEAMVRNLATMTRVGLLTSMSKATQTVLEKMGNEEAVRSSRIHPIKVLAGLLTYKSGMGVRGNHVWTPVNSIVGGLDDMFYATFPNIVPTGKRIVFALDVSGSMGLGQVGGVPGLSPRLASAALLAFMLRTEKMYEVIGFTSGGYYGLSRNRNYNNVSGVTSLSVNSKMSLNQIIATVSALPFGGTDCSLPMEWARVNKIEADAFQIFTDNETYAGARHPSQALKAYREATGIDAKLIVNGMTATNFTIADPKDAGMLDVVGFDTSAPTLVNDFIRGDI